MTRMFLKIAVTAILAATLASAQRGGGGNSKGGNSIGEPIYEPPNRFDQTSSLLRLNKDQKKLLRAAMDEGQKEAAPLCDQILQSQAGIGDAVAAGKGQQEIDRAANAFAALDARMTAIEMKVFAKIYNSLEKDQQNKTGPVFLMMRGVFKGKNWLDARP